MNCSSWYMRARPMRWSDESGKQESTAAVTCWLAARALRSRRTGSGEEFSMRRTYCNGRSPHIKCEKEAIILARKTQAKTPIPRYRSTACKLMWNRAFDLQGDFSHLHILS